MNSVFSDVNEKWKNVLKDRLKRYKRASKDDSFSNTIISALTLQLKAGKENISSPLTVPVCQQPLTSLNAFNSLQPPGIKIQPTLPLQQASKNQIALLPQAESQIQQFCLKQLSLLKNPSQLLTQGPAGSSLCPASNDRQILQSPSPHQSFNQTSVNGIMTQCSPQLSLAPVIPKDQKNITNQMSGQNDLVTSLSSDQTSVLPQQLMAHKKPSEAVPVTMLNSGGTPINIAVSTTSINQNGSSFIAQSTNSVIFDQSKLGLHKSGPANSTADVPMLPQHLPPFDRNSLGVNGNISSAAINGNIPSAAINGAVINQVS